MDLLVHDGRILEKGRNLQGGPEVDTMDARGRVIIPGLINAHAHLGLDPFAGLQPGNGTPATQAARIASLSAAHGEESVIWSAFVGALESVRTGTTCVFDLHTSPRFVAGSLTRLQDVLLTVGLRCMLAYRLTEEESQDALTPIREAAAYGGNDQLRMAVGIGDPATLSQETLSTLAKIVEQYEAPVHAEASYGAKAATACEKEHGSGPLQRLQAAGLLGPQTIVARGAELSDAEAQAAHDAEATLVLSPGDDLLDAAGRRPLAPSISNSAIGTGAGPTDLLAELRTAWRLARAAGEDISATQMLSLLSAGHAFAGRIFGVPFGIFEPGAAADLVLLDYTPAIPLNADTVAHHVLLGIEARHVESVMIHGRVIYKHRKMVDLNPRDLFRQTQRGALDLWQEWTGTTFPGWSPEQAQDVDEPDETEMVQPPPLAEEREAEMSDDSEDDRPDEDLPEQAIDEEPASADLEDEEGSEEEDSEFEEDEEEDEAAEEEEEEDSEEEARSASPEDPFGAGIF